MSDFRRLEDAMFASPQITLNDISAAVDMGIALVINNRPEHEAPDQTPGNQIAAAARAAGMSYCAIPVTPGGFSLEQVEQMVVALNGASGPVLAYCRSGTRSTLLWALAQAKLGRPPAELGELAGRVGYDLSPIRPMLDALSVDRA